MFIVPFALSLSAHATTNQIDLNESDSSNIFDKLNTGTTNTVSETKSVGHWRFDEINNDTDSQLYPYKSTAYFLNSDGSFRLQCSGVTGPLGTLDAKCFYETNSDASDPAKTLFVTDDVTGVTTVKFMSPDDVNATRDIVGDAFILSGEQITVKLADGSNVRKPLLQIGCSADGKNCQAKLHSRL
jgi:hypothetical protein